MNIIPLPNKIEKKDGIFKLSNNTCIECGENVQESIAELLAGYIKDISGNNLLVSSSVTEKTDKITLSVISSDESKNFEENDESYKLTVDNDNISITAQTNTGLARGIQTLRQLLYNSDNGAVSCCEIEDAPCFKWRGLHLDVSRHFFTVEEVCKFIDTLALHHMNICHLHLTDDQGWRIEIKKYPELTEIASKRKATLIGHARKRPYQYDNKPHEGFFTQDDIRKIVEFASARHITLVPEIDLPGHMQAAIAAYPEWGCTTEKVEVRCHWGISQHILNPEESTVNAMKDILDEVMALFPGTYIHIGGDEADKKHWQESRRVQELIKERGLADEAEMQSWFIRQMDNHIRENGRKLIGWDEILEGGINKTSTVMCWREEKYGIEAALAGCDVVMAPNTWTYFDYYQAEPKEKEPLAIGGMLHLDHVYSFNPIPEELPEDKRKHILGGQGQLWTEYMPTMEHVMYMTYPRAAALAEVLWTTKDKHDIMNFLMRLQQHRKTYNKLEINAHPRPMFAGTQ